MLHTLCIGALILLAFTLLFKLFIFAKRGRVSDLDSKSVLITGCDSGFGRATAMKLDQLGLRVFATCLTEEGATRLQKSCSHRVKTFLLDVTNSAQIKQVHEQVKAELEPEGKGLWGLVNNAGVCVVGPLEWVPLTTYKKLADVNLWGMIDVTQTFLPLIKKSRGRIVNMSSIAGRITLSHYTPYAIAKYGVEAFSDGLRREIAPWGVGVSMVEPGGYKTALLDNMNAEMWIKTWNQLSEGLKADYGEEFLKESISIMESIKPRCSSDISPVANAIVDCIISSSPPPRYGVGPDAKYLFLWLSNLPSWMADWVLSTIIPTAVPRSCKSRDR